MFACLYSPSASRDTLERVARAFSPRIEPGGSIVLLDISGLGRLLGEPHAIAEELQRAVVAQDSPVLVAQDFSPALPAGLKPCATYHDRTRDEYRNRRYSHSCSTAGAKSSRYHRD